MQIRLNPLLLRFAVIFICFPYTAFFSSTSYTQPYALLFGVTVVLFNQRLLLNFAHKKIFTLLLYLLFFGIGIFALSAFPYGNLQDIKSLLSFISPVIYASVGFIALQYYPRLTTLTLSVSAFIWIIVSTIQIVNPSFATFLVGQWSEAGIINSLSGRGSMGLAPEPTHNGFHLIILGASIYIAHGSKSLSKACILSAIFLAKSASAFLVVVLATFFLLLRLFPLGLLILSVIFLFSYKFILDAVQIFPDLESTRMFNLIINFIESPEKFLQIDYSVNQRLGGIYIGLGEVISNWFMPQGMSNAYWLKDSRFFIDRYPWSFGISSSGVPSGYLNMIYQGGLVCAIILMILNKYILRVGVSLYGSWLLLAVALVFVGQYMLSNPGYGFVVGLVASRLTTTINVDKEW